MTSLRAVTTVRGANTKRKSKYNWGECRLLTSRRARELHLVESGNAACRPRLHKPGHRVLDEDVQVFAI